MAEPGNDASLPGWLEPYVVREVTGERGYHDDVLARRPSRSARPRGGAGPDGSTSGASAPAADGKPEERSAPPESGGP